MATDYKKYAKSGPLYSAIFVWLFHNTITLHSMIAMLWYSWSTEKVLGSWDCEVEGFLVSTNNYYAKYCIFCIKHSIASEI